MCTHFHAFSATQVILLIDISDSDTNYDVIAILHAESLAQPDHSSCPPIQFVKGEPVHNEAMHKVTSDPNKTRPMVNFSLRFHHDQSKLTVHLKEARNLPKECRKECDPFVVLHLEPDREDTFQTKVHKSTNRPEFNKIFQFEGLSAERVKDQRLVFRFFNHALGNKPIGKVCHPLNEEVLKASASSMREEIACTEETVRVQLFNNYCAIVHSFKKPTVCLYYRTATREICFCLSNTIPLLQPWPVQSVKRLD